MAHHFKWNSMSHKKYLVWMTIIDFENLKINEEEFHEIIATI